MFKFPSNPRDSLKHEWTNWTILFCFILFCFSSVHLLSAHCKCNSKICCFYVHGVSKERNSNNKKKTIHTAAEYWVKINDDCGNTFDGEWLIAEPKHTPSLLLLLLLSRSYVYIAIDRYLCYGDIHLYTSIYILQKWLKGLHNRIAYTITKLFDIKIDVHLLFSVISFGWVKEPALDYFNSWIMWQTNLLARSLNKIYALRMSRNPNIGFFPLSFGLSSRIKSSEQQIEIILLLFFWAQQE